MSAQPRGTSNGNCSGNAQARRRRKVWLVETYRADQDLGPFGPCNQDWGEPACRCYRCGTLLTKDTVTADRIIPGDAGGTYRRDNIRPACGPCNSITGNQYRWAKERAKAQRRATSAARARATRAARKALS